MAVQESAVHASAPTDTVPFSAFEAAYADTSAVPGGTSSGPPPWEIGAPQPTIVALAESGRIFGKVLDVGCGTGENSLFLADRGMDVLGIDASAVAVETARTKAKERSLDARFRVADALHLEAIAEQFDCVVDSGLLHLFSDHDRQRLIDGIHTVLRPGGTYHLLCFSRRRPPPAPRRLGRDDITASFGSGWRVESLVESRYDVRDAPSTTNAWLGRIVRLP